MNKEVKIYLINADDFDLDVDSPVDLSNDEFMDESEKQGLVYSLGGFEDAFNNDYVSDQWYMRILPLKQTP